MWCRPICDAVRARGVEAIAEFSARFDGVEQDRHRGAAPRPCRTRSAASTPPSGPGWRSRSAGSRRPARPSSSTTSSPTSAAGARVTHRKVPVERVGLYVPGGLAPLVSSVVMNVVPAQVAGVRSIALTSPPQKDHGGLPHPTILAACALLGVDEVYAVGGAQAIAMFAYGAGPCRKVDLVTGPGNIYTVAAKRLLKGVVGIDSEAGPTEIAILADDTADAAFVAADLISQAEHDPLAASRAGHRLVRAARRRGRGRARQAGLGDPARRADPHRAGRPAVRRSCWSTTSSRASTWSTPTPPSTSRSRPPTPPPGPPGCATPGAIFVGPYAPVSLGDYCAGSNHVLPTAGCACHSSGLSVRAFLKSVHVVDYSRAALAEVADHVVDAGRGRGPARPRRRGPRPVRATDRSDDAVPPLREELRGIEPYGAPPARRARPAQRQREPLRPVAEAVVADIAGRRWRRPPPRLNRYPDREFAELRAALAAYLARSRRSRHRPGAGVGGQRVQRGDAAAAAGLRRPGPGRAVSFAPTYSMYPEYARDTITGWVVGHRETDFSLDLDARARPGRASTGRPSCCCPRRTTRPAPRCRPRRSTCSASAAGASRASWSSTRRTASSGAPAPRARSSCCREHRNLVVTPHHEQGVRAGRRPARLPRRGPRRSATRSGWSGCPTTSPRSPRRPRWPRCGTRPSCSAGSTTCAPSATRPSAWLREQGLEVADSDANFALFGTLRDRHAVWQGLLDRGVLIRETGPDGWLRVSIGTAEEMAGVQAGTAVHESTWRSAV